MPLMCYRLLIHPTHSYLVMSATTENELALSVVDLLIRRGAVNILLHLQQNRCRDDAYIRFKMM